MKHPISEIMETDVYTCPYTLSLGDVVREFRKKKVTSLPVVDDNRRVVGFVSDGDILKAVAEQKTRAIASGYSTMLFYDSESFEDKVAALKDRNVMELATRKVMCAATDQSIGSVADVLSKRTFKQLPVVDAEGKLVGVVRRATITQYIFDLLFGEDES